MKKFKEEYEYCIENNLCSTVYNNHFICKTIASKIDEFELWENGVQYPLTHFIDRRGSSYINAVFQSLSHILALTRLILETNTFDNLMDPVDNLLSLYIVQIMRNNRRLESNSHD